MDNQRLQSRAYQHNLTIAKALLLREPVSENTPWHERPCSRRARPASVVRRSIGRDGPSGSRLPPKVPDEELKPAIEEIIVCAPS